jgi:hypothetical protein
MAGRKSILVERVCEVCGTKFDFIAHPCNVAGGRGRFCSVACFYRSRTSRVERTCEVCGTHFLAYPCKIAQGRGRFCSKDCRNLWQTVPLIERFYYHVGPVTDTGCILWTGTVSRGGYGTISSVTVQGGKIFAHRVSYRLFIGPIPDDLFVLHRCDNPPCINPFHLFLGTLADNQADMKSKGRQCKGENIRGAKLTEEKVRDIRDRYQRGGVTQEQLAADHGVTRRAIGRALSGETWDHVRDQCDCHTNPSRIDTQEP